MLGAILGAMQVVSMIAKPAAALGSQITGLIGSQQTLEGQYKTANTNLDLLLKKQVAQNLSINGSAQKGIFGERSLATINRAVQIGQVLNSMAMSGMQASQAGRMMQYVNEINLANSQEKVKQAELDIEQDITSTQITQQKQEIENIRRQQENEKSKSIWDIIGSFFGV